MDDGGIPDTRVFVSGLPPNFTSEQLGAHFAMRYQVTDAVVVPGRRIGFVGFRNYTLAKNAVKYFDKSYIRMSKISVEMAKPIDTNRDSGSQAATVSPKATRQHSHSDKTTTVTPSLPALGSGTPPGGSSFQPYMPLNPVSKSNKRKRDAEGQERQGDFQDFMATTQTTGSKPTWANETDEAAATTTTASTHTLQAVTGADVANGSLKKPKSKDKTAKQDRESDPGLAPRDERNVTREEKKRKRSKPGEETEAGETPTSRNHTTVKDEDISHLGAKVAKKKKRQEGTTNSESCAPEAQTEHEVSGLRSPKAKKKERKNSKEAKGVDESRDDASGLNEEDADRTQLEDTRTDSDWLRARTNRTLDLVDVQEVPTKALEHAVSEGSNHSTNSSYHEAEPCMTAPPHVVQPDLEESLANGRLFIRNLPYSADEADVKNLFSKYGKVNEVHIVQDVRASTSRGIAYVQYGDSSSAAQALQHLDGVSFQGRLLHVLPALDRKSQKLDDYEISKLPPKKQREINRKRGAANATFSWNSLYMNPDAVLSSVADRLGVGKSELLDPTSSDAAVKQAHAETHIIQETKSYLNAKGINLDAFKQSFRDDRTLLVKNFPFGVTTEDLRQLLEPHGHISQLLMPPTGTMAIVQYSEASQAAQALKQLAYKNLKGSVLFLERGPRGLFDQQAARDSDKAKPSKPAQDSIQIPDEATDSRVKDPSSTLFVRNLNFATTTARLKEAFEPVTGFLSAKVKTRIDPKRPGQALSMGFGFVEFRTTSQARAAISVMNGHKLDDHELIVEFSRNATDTAEERRYDDVRKKLEAKKTKVVIKNLPFEASKKDVRSLFGAYGQLRSVRVPKKFDHSTRGFAFADFVSAKEAENAIEALANTHFLGRRLVLEFASGDAIDPEDEIRAMEQRVSQQTNMINLSKMTGSGRRKFTVDARDDESP